MGRADDLRLALGHNVRLAVSEPADLERAIKTLYRTQIEVDQEEEPVDDADFERSAQREEISEAGGDIPAVKLVHTTMAQAIEDGASDIHFEPQEEEMVVRARIDGVTRPIATIPKPMQPAVVTRLKIMGQLDIAERRAPQDGRVSVRFGGEPLDLRIAVLPTTHGEQVVLRIMHRAVSKPDLGELGMTAAAREQFEQAIRQPYGTVIVCGPTGSGKTTTLYTALHMLNDPGRVLMTIEDPVEYQIPGINQVEISIKSGLTFARGLRTILRSDPDVLLVGEIRDEETARIAMQAGMTGHLVLTHRARAQRGQLDRPPEGHGRRDGAARELGQLRGRAAAGAPSLHGLPRVVLAGGRGAPAARPDGAEGRGLPPPARRAAGAAATPASAAASPFTR